MTWLTMSHNLSWAFILVQDVSIHCDHESKVGYGFSPYAELFGVG